MHIIIKHKTTFTLVTPKLQHLLQIEKSVPCQI